MQTPERPHPPLCEVAGVPKESVWAHVRPGALQQSLGPYKEEDTPDGTKCWGCGPDDSVTLATAVSCLSERS